ncbi:MULTISPECIES: hypothetical protein [Rhizobium]|uniref:hypothetical protein n=1 Tax=Rhizobium TaxID=379 RepID=UPI0031334530
MCNLYNLTTNQAAIRDLISITHFRAGNLEPSLHIHPTVLAQSSASTPVASASWP